MNLFINSPAYFTQMHGIIDDIYVLCKNISNSIDVKNYTEYIDTIGITPIIAPEDIIKQGLWKEEKKISIPYRMGSISLHTDYVKYCEANLDQKKEMILDNILQSLKVVKGRLKNKFDYDKMEGDIIVCVLQMRDCGESGFKK